MIYSSTRSFFPTSSALRLLFNTGYDMTSAFTVHFPFFSQLNLKYFPYYSSRARRRRVTVLVSIEKEDLGQKAQACCAAGHIPCHWLLPSVNEHYDHPQCIYPSAFRCAARSHSESRKERDKINK
jgi:hypothetical protein